MRILILGGGVMQLPAVRLSKSRGWNVVVAAAGIGPEIEELADRCEQVDLRDREAVTRFARDLERHGGLDGVFTAGTDFSTTVAWAAERLGLPCIPYEAAVTATDKARMRAAFQANDVPSPRFFTVKEGSTGSGATDSGAAGSGVQPAGVQPAGVQPAGVQHPVTQPPRARSRLLTLPEGFSFPLVVKPVDNMGARGVRRVDDPDQLQEAIRIAWSQSASGQAIVEQYLEGPELSLDALIHEGEITICGVADRHIFFPPYFVEMGHTMPSELSQEVLSEAEEVFRRGIRALGITRGAAKGDIKITPEGAVIGEIAARLSGGYMSGWTYPFASGVEVTSGALNIAVGLPPGDLEPRRNWVSAERAFISIPGTVRTLEGLEQARGIPGIEELFLRVSTGQQVRLPINNMGKCGNLISRAPSRAQAVEAAERAVRSVLVRLEAADPLTDAFLQGVEQSGFSAFADFAELCPETKRRLERMEPWMGDPDRFSGAAEDLRILSLPGAGGGRVRDWHGWTLEEAFHRVLEISGAAEQSAGPGDPLSFCLGRVFWNALIKGGVQAGVYVIDSLCTGAGKPKYILRKWLS
jgi:biotin carboxylase